ncbi:hypothetical protein DNTS_014271 [Danionella cerebrum]|uniref:Uncharacterized protein n=1 Tax=Danionella cerebrum TaxID=2873325 RepID=A0A553R404_9TELE|nr:hypothetical protein DNTS_014271 [Danionella translucida]TRY96910.1 hypothetical protein DNTS_014271 [Danionella translucida]
MIWTIRFKFWHICSGKTSCLSRKRKF